MNSSDDKAGIGPSADPRKDAGAAESGPGGAASPHRAGFAAIIGAPNSGKSSLMNRYLGRKVSIVTRKPQTTRRRVLGVLSEPGAQIVFLDTPGVHEPTKALNREMVSMARSALSDADVCLWLVDGLRRGAEHRLTLETLVALNRSPLVAAVNKADLLAPDRLEDLLAEIGSEVPTAPVLAVSAKTGRGLRRLKRALVSLLPQSPPLFDQDDLTDQTLRAIAAEYVREAVFELTRQEIPYSSAVTVDEFLEPEPGARNPLLRISATIHVEKESQKKVMIGFGGRTIKEVGRTARLRLEGFVEARVHLSLFVRVTEDWSDDPRALSDFGYLDL
jgi:GTP-binding protein Era